MPVPHYFVYVVLLSSEVLKHQKFIKANVAYKAGIQANRFVQQYGVRLMPELVDDLKQPMTYKDAQYLEVEVGIKLKELGYGVWQA